MSEEMSFDHYQLDVDRDSLRLLEVETSSQHQVSLKRNIFIFWPLHPGQCWQGIFIRCLNTILHCLPFQRRTDLNVKKFLDRYKLLHINIDFKNEYQPNVLRIEFAFTAADGTLQKNIFKYRKDPKDRKKLLFQVN